MKTCRLLLCLLTLALIVVSCEKRTESDSGTDVAKVRPEVAVASKGASPTPGLGDMRTKPAPSPSSTADSSSPR
jgi:hypothetical protein